jgi:hypothetical protein
MHRSVAYFAVLVSFASPCAAQDPPVGMVLLPKEPLVLFDRPPSGLFAAPTAKAVVQDRGQGIEVQALVPDPQSPQGYAVQAQPAPAGEGLLVTDYIDIYQGQGLARWVHVVPAGPAAAAQPDGGASEGWTPLPPGLGE